MRSAFFFVRRLRCQGNRCRRHRTEDRETERVGVSACGRVGVWAYSNMVA
jgi:hypothetical protein